MNSKRILLLLCIWLRTKMQHSNILFQFFFIVYWMKNGAFFHIRPFWIHLYHSPSGLILFIFFSKIFSCFIFLIVSTYLANSSNICVSGTGVILHLIWYFFCWSNGVQYIDWWSKSEYTCITFFISCAIFNSLFEFTQWYNIKKHKFHWFLIKNIMKKSK